MSSAAPGGTGMAPTETPGGVAGVKGKAQAGDRDRSLGGGSGAKPFSGPLSPVPAAGVLHLRRRRARHARRGGHYGPRCALAVSARRGGRRCGKDPPLPGDEITSPAARPAAPPAGTFFYIPDGHLKYNHLSAMARWGPPPPTLEDRKARRGGRGERMPPKSSLPNPGPQAPPLWTSRTMSGSVRFGGRKRFGGRSADGERCFPPVCNPTCLSAPLPPSLSEVERCK